MQTTGQSTNIHLHVSGELGLFANAYLIEINQALVAIDATLTVSEARAMRVRIASLDKRLLAVLLTHAHPDHAVGLTKPVGSSNVPIIAFESVERVMRATEEAKRQQ